MLSAARPCSSARSSATCRTRSRLSGAGGRRRAFPRWGTTYSSQLLTGLHRKSTVTYIVSRMMGAPMRTAVLLAVALILAFAILGVAFVVGMRHKTPVVLNAVRRAGRAMKPLVLRSAGRHGSPTSVVEHVGRKSGRRYETPVVAARSDDGFVIALPYGLNTDWLKNVLTAGRGTVRFDGASYAVD